MKTKYTKLKLLGQGGMGEVWLVSDPERHLYAAKFIRQNLTREKDILRFYRELEVLRSIQHDNIVKIYDILEDSDAPGYVMEFCPDGDVAKYLFQYPDTNKWSIIVQLADAVAHLHEQGFIHRDIKPQNILVAPNGSIRLSDFGLVVEINPEREVLTTSSWVSPGFSAPEQYFSMANVGQRADIFSIGAVYYYLLRGKTLDIEASIESQLEGFEGLDRQFFRKSLSKDPNQRFISVRSLLKFHHDGRQIQSGDYWKLDTADERKTYLLEIWKRYVTDVDSIYLGKGYNALVKGANIVESFLDHLLEFESDQEIQILIKQLVLRLEEHQEYVRNLGFDD